MNMICEFFQAFFWQKCLASGAKSWNTRKNCFWIIIENSYKILPMRLHCCRTCVGRVKTVVTNHLRKMFRIRIHKAAERNTATRINLLKPVLYAVTNILLLGQATICSVYYPVPSYTKMYERPTFHFCDCFLVSKWIFQYHDGGLTKFHAGSELPPMCVVINNSSVKNNNTAYHAIGKYWMKAARVFPNYRLKHCCPKGIYCVCQPNQLKREIKKKLEVKQGPTKNLGAVTHPGTP